MIELKGKYNKDCKIFIDNVEDEALSLIYGINSSATVSVIIALT